MADGGADPAGMPKPEDGGSSSGSTDETTAPAGAALSADPEGPTARAPAPPVATRTRSQTQGAEIEEPQRAQEALQAGGWLGASLLGQDQEAPTGEEPTAPEAARDALPATAAPPAGGAADPRLSAPADPAPGGLDYLRLVQEIVQESSSYMEQYRQEQNQLRQELFDVRQQLAQAMNRRPEPLVVDAAKAEAEQLKQETTAWLKIDHDGFKPKSISRDQVAQDYLAWKPIWKRTPEGLRNRGGLGAGQPVLVRLNAAFANFLEKLSEKEGKWQEEIQRALDQPDENTIDWRVIDKVWVELDRSLLPRDTSFKLADEIHTARNTHNARPQEWYAALKSKRDRIRELDPTGRFVRDLEDSALASLFVLGMNKTLRSCIEEEIGGEELLYGPKNGDGPFEYSDDQFLELLERCDKAYDRKNMKPVTGSATPLGVHNVSVTGKSKKSGKPKDPTEVWGFHKTPEGGSLDAKERERRAHQLMDDPQNWSTKWQNWANGSYAKLKKLNVCPSCGTADCEFAEKATEFCTKSTYKGKPFRAKYRALHNWPTRAPLN